MYLIINSLIEKVIINMKIEIEKNDKGLDVAVIQLSGRLDAQHAGTVEEKIMKAINDGYINLLINMDEINYLGSSGIKVFLALNNKLNDVNGKLKIVNMHETGIKILKAMEIIDRFNLYNSKSGALNSF